MIKGSPIIGDIDAVQRLRKLLVINYTLPPAAAGIFLLTQHVLTFLKISNPVLVMLIFIAISPPVLVTPFIFYVLYREKRYGWLVSYFLIVILPVVIFYLIFQDMIEYIIWLPVYMVPFYFYCFLIKFSVDEWIREYNFHVLYLLQKKELEEREKEGLL
ncbi:MAG: hypothetical protein WBQ32_06070 [Ignavibacteriaceae bacterium]